MTGAGTQEQEHERDTVSTPPPGAVRVSRAVGAHVGTVWEVLVSPAGSQALLGEGAVLGGKGEHYTSADGTSGVLRSYHPLEQLRVTWHGTPDGPPSVVELDLTPDGDAATRLDLTQDHPGHGVDADALARRWAAGLDRLASLAEARR